MTRPIQNAPSILPPITSPFIELLERPWDETGGVAVLVAAHVGSPVHSVLNGAVVRDASIKAGV